MEQVLGYFRIRKNITYIGILVGAVTIATGVTLYDANARYSEIQKKAEMLLDENNDGKVSRNEWLLGYRLSGRDPSKDLNSKDLEMIIKSIGQR